MIVWKDIVFSYICPSLGCIVSAAMYAAPVQDLKLALASKEQGTLNPVPWAVMTGNCLGWCVYGYYTHDPFMLASNFPGLIVSIWLNIGAAKLQYHQNAILLHRNEQENENEEEYRHSLMFVPQEILLLRILMVWLIILITVGWLGLVQNQARVIGILVNINLLFFYGAPLQTLRTVIREKSSDSIHRPTMIMNIFNTSFWSFYGLARNDPVIYIPNLFGSGLIFLQVMLSCWYPTIQATTNNNNESIDGLDEPLLSQEDMTSREENMDHYENQEEQP